MTPVNITPTEAKKLVDAGALLVDIREPDEYLREHIPGARLVAISSRRAAPRDDHVDVSRDIVLLYKPFTLEELAQTLREALDQRS